ncbi:MAG: helix-turn-helix transcriptional regulator, partial [Alistipes onderdonkii]|nr:helix-turn-helix transcriptional regulator [Alistipes onderdonkii]
QLPGWTPRNYDFAALVVAGFSAQEISVMLDMTLNGVYTLKSKLKRRIAESGAPDREFFTRFFA